MSLKPLRLFRMFFSGGKDTIFAWLFHLLIIVFHGSILHVIVDCAWRFCSFLAGVMG